MTREGYKKHRAAFNKSYHASKSRNAPKRDTANPCAICGWSEHMAIHETGNRHLKGIGHEYQVLAAVENLIQTTTPSES